MFTIFGGLENASLSLLLLTLGAHNLFKLKQGEYKNMLWGVFMFFRKRGLGTGQTGKDACRKMLEIHLTNSRKS